MSDKKTIFLTGATGLVGSYLLRVFLQKGYKVYALARGKDDKDKMDRVIDILKFWHEDLPINIRSLNIVEGDVTENNLGVSKKDFFSLSKEIQQIFHSAAAINYNWSLKEIRKVNVIGTKRVLDFALQCKKNGRFEKVNHISSAYVCGNYRGVFTENDLDVGQEFNTPYEQSKFEAEKLIHVYRNRGLIIEIFRPSIVIGESMTGKIPKFQQHFYQVLRIWSLGIFDYFPGKDCFAHIVPVDELCKSIFTISFNSPLKNRTYHLFSSHRISLEKVLDIYRNLLGTKIPKAISLKQMSKSYFTPSQRIILKNLFFTFNGYAKLDSRITEGLLRKYGFTYSKINKNFFNHIFEYLTKTNFFNNKYLSEKGS